MPQGHPVIVQAGASEQGRELGLTALFVTLALAGCSAATTGSGQAPSPPYQQSEPRDTGGMH